jgi:hypothetical protein
MLAVIIAAALAAAAPAPALQTPAPQSATDPAASQATAAALARTVAPADLMIPMEVEQAKKAILALPTLDADAKELEKLYPGVWAAVWAASEPEMRRSATADFPKFWAALEQLYTSRLTEPEAQAVLTFYRSASGQKLLRGLIQNFDATPIVAGVAKSDSGKISAEQLGEATEAAKAAAAKGVGPEVMGDLMELLHAISLDKFKAVGAETQKITLDWVNKEDPESEKRLEDVMKTAVTKYIAAHPAKP